MCFYSFGSSWLPQTSHPGRCCNYHFAHCTRPDLCAPSQLLSSFVPKHPSPKVYREIEKIFKWCHETSDIGLNFVRLNLKQLKLMLFTDASFANADRLKSQLGFVVVLSDETGKANILHYGSTKCKQVARSVMAAELHALLYGFDNSYMAQSMLQDVLGQEICIDAYVDSQTVFYVVAKHSSTLEKRLRIDVHALRQSYATGELRYMTWIPGIENIADDLTKGLITESHPLWNLLKETVSR